MSNSMRQAARNAAAIGILAAGMALTVGLGVWVWNLLLGLVTATQMLGMVQ